MNLAASLDLELRFDKALGFMFEFWLGLVFFWLCFGFVFGLATVRFLVCNFYIF